MTNEVSGRVRTYAGSELLGTAIYNLEVVTQHLGILGGGCYLGEY